MLSAILKLLLREVSQLAKRGRNWLTSLAAERRTALRLDRLADRLRGMGIRIDILRKRMNEGRLDEPLDADASLREALRGLKEDIRTVRCQLSVLSGPGSSPRLQRAFARLAAVAEKTYAAADKLQWEIDEHDQMGGAPQAPPATRLSA
ncbi:hypothetical protein IV454_17310 [Massilia antarctica]|uniref:Uncharacterized protein n=1 Tax=Massilia antarctica TaxID=2765360 RepID=A0AA49A5E1_9BURK|nr:hypothetical protein [Massilia antarctica]QPI47374.1 hypothetical protein IV454_17310 [Massilia antarctica]